MEIVDLTHRSMRYIAGKERMDGRVGRRLHAGRAGWKGQKQTPATTIIFNS